ncbi:MAG: hypothetical protein OXN88_18060 [Chloroflexota bacterium]|nr:hypothetical protein [Chloroflexota bacterium]
MSLPGILIALVLSLIALAIVARPLLRPPRRERAMESNRREQRGQVLSYYERVLTNMRDLDEDRSTGKIDEEDYRTEREVWAQRGIRLLRALDQLEGAEDDADGIERAIEEAVAAYRESRLRERAEEEASA